MKNIQKSLLTLLLLFIFLITFSQITKEKALVKGECGMCKDRIEKTAVVVSGPPDRVGSVVSDIFRSDSIPF